MTLQQLNVNYAELQLALSNAYEVRPWSGDRIDGIANRLADTEREIVANGGKLTEAVVKSERPPVEA